MTANKPSVVLPVLLSTSFLFACSSLPSYEGPSAENKASAASIENTGGRFSCGPLGSYPRICNATVNVIDGKKVAFFGSSIQADPGPHRIQLLCFYQRDGSPTSKVGFFRLIDVVLAPNGKYVVEPREENNACRLALVDTTGKEVESKEVQPPAGPGVQLRAPGN
jgi:hypothetical protein